MTRRIVSLIVALVLIVCLLPVGAIEAKAASAMKASDDIVLYLKSMEGFTPIPRWDYVQWTVGYGNRCPDEHLARYLEEGIPVEEADALFLEQLVYFEDQVNAFIDRNNLNLNQHQFDAVLSITYNCGAAWLTGNSELKKAIISGADGNTLVGLMSQWCTAGGEYLAGLMRRRLTEADIYLNGRYNTQAPSNYCYVFFDAGSGTASAVAQGYDCNLYAAPMVTATREGYTFLGWYTEEVGGVKVTYLDENMHQDTLYAHWQAGEGVYDGGTSVPDGITVTVTGSVVNVRRGPGTSYAVVDSVARGETVVVTQVADGQDGRLWGKIEAGWLCLAYTNYEDLTGGSDDSEEDTDDTENGYEVPVYATIVGTNALPVYNGPHTGYPKVGTLSENAEVLIVEVYNMFGTWWGRLETGGWICLNRYVLLHNDQMLAHSVFVTVTNSYVNVRNGPGTSYTWLDSLNKGEVIEILAVETVGTAIWGRYSGGWLSLQYTDFDSGKLEQYKEHHYGDWYTVSSSTCVSHGLQQRDCLYCDANETQELPLGNHSMGQWYDYTAATCVTEGTQRRECGVCSYYELRNTGYSCHSYGQWQEHQAATCTEDGVNRRYCQHCDSFEEEVAAATGHSYGQWQEHQAATCTEDGANRRYCQHCDAFEEEVVAAAGHSFGDWYEVVAPTLTEGGQERRDCLHCDHYELRETSVAEHLFTDWYVVKAPTCTETGELRRDCIDCEYYETKEIAAIGHSYGDWEVSVPGSCTEDRILQQTCCHCGDVQTKTEAAPGHTMGKWYTVTEPGCEAVGQRRRDCENCDHYDTETIAAIGHAMGQWHIDTEPTCAAEGLQSRECQNCSYCETKPIEKLAHTFCDWYISIEPTYETPGQERRDCQHCQAYETREKAFNGQVITRVYATVTVSALNIRSGAGTGYSWVGSTVYGNVHEVYEQTTVSGKAWGRIDKGWICLTGNTSVEEVVEVIAHTHSFGDWYAVTEATCTEAGLRRHDCACGHYETEVVAAIGHRYGAWYTVTEATCTEAGLRRHDCACGHYETEAVAATGHSYGDWYTVTEATASQNGLERRDCACGHYETRETVYEGTTVTKIYATITVSSLNVRSGPGTGYSWVGAVAYGTVHEVLEQTTVGNKVWGRIEKGWICLTGYTTLQEVEEAVEHSHSFGAWYTVTEATCTANGEKRRDCSCGEYETEVIAATGHSYGEWYTVTEAKPGENGLERRDCACGHYETRETVYEGATVTKVYATITVAALNVRSGAGTGYSWVATVTYGTVHEVFEQVTVGGKVWGRIEEGWICLTGYTTLEEVTEAADTTAVQMTVNALSLNVRAGAGTNYDIVTGLSYGTEVTVLETKTVGNTTWARIEQGWVSMTYLK